VEPDRDLPAGRVAHVKSVPVSYLQDVSRKRLARLNLYRGRGSCPEKEKRAQKDPSKKVPGVIHRGGHVSVECISLISCSIGLMHKPDHVSVLPGHVDPIPMPDSPREAIMLLLLLEAGLYPKIVPAEPEKTRPDEG